MEEAVAQGFAEVLLGGSLTDFGKPVLDTLLPHA
jgi:hypothetical protein